MTTTYKNALWLVAAALVFMVFSFSLITRAQAATLSGQLDVGNKGADVTALQTFLAADPTIYPEGLITGYYGPLTQKAVMRFQSSQGISAVGRVGPQTLAKINSYLSSGLSLGGDKNAPLITNVSVATSTAGTATITWTTSEGAKGKVYYQTSFPAMTEVMSAPPVISGTAQEENGFSMNHTITLTGLQSNTTYYYVVQSIDSAGNVTVVWPTTFTAK